MSEQLTPTYLGYTQLQIGSLAAAKEEDISMDYSPSSQPNIRVAVSEIKMER